MSGLVIIAASVLTCIALASWNVEDPSFTHATNQPGSNLLGFAGSSLSDLLFQFFGMVGVALALLPAIWGFHMIRLRLRKISLKQIAYFLGIILFASGVAACLPVPETWPMPTGLGGITGNGLIALPTLFFNDALSGHLSVVLAIILALPFHSYSLGHFSSPIHIKTLILQEK